MKSFLFLMTAAFLCAEINAQCAGGISGGALAAPTTAWQTITVRAGRYYTFTVPAGTCNKYDFSFCQGGASCSYDSQITIRDNADVYAGGYSDDVCGTNAEIIGWTPSTSGTYRVLINQYNCAGNATNVTLAYRYAATGNNGDYQFLDDASINGNCVNLTPASNNMRGCAWDANQTLNFASNFTYDFTINLGSSDAGADGIAFVMHNDPLGRCVCGTPGGAVGAGGITNSLTVEIDTYLNTEDRDDGMTGVLCSGGPEPDHLDIWLNGVVNPEYGSSCVTNAGERVVSNAVRLMNGGSIYNIENGLDHKLRIAWNASTTTLTATVMDNGLSTTYGTISYSFNPVTIFGTNTPYFGFTGSTGGLNNSQYFCNPPVLLPLELVEFSVACKDEGGTLLHWKTASENSNDFFTVERSPNGVDFIYLADLPGQGTTHASHEYFFEDKSAPSGNAYYRLSQTDLDGTKSFFPLQQVQCDGKKEFEILSVRHEEGQVLLVANTTGGNHQLRIFDVVGKLLFSSVENFPSGKISYSIPLSLLEQGVYFLDLEYRNERVVTRFVR